MDNPHIPTPVEQPDGDTPATATPEPAASGNSDSSPKRHTSWKVITLLAAGLTLLLAFTILILAAIPDSKPQPAQPAPAPTDTLLTAAQNASTASHVAAIMNVLSNARYLNANVTITDGVVTATSNESGTQTIRTGAATVTYTPRPDEASLYTVEETTPETGCVFAATETDTTPTHTGEHCELPPNN